MAKDYKSPHEEIAGATTLNPPGGAAISDDHKTDAAEAVPQRAGNAGATAGFRRLYGATPQIQDCMLNEGDERYEDEQRDLSDWLSENKNSESAGIRLLERNPRLAGTLVRSSGLLYLASVVLKQLKLTQHFVHNHAAHMNLQNPWDNDTALHRLTASWADPLCFLEVVTAGAALNIKNSKHLTPFDSAILRNNKLAMCVFSMLDAPHTISPEHPRCQMSDDNTQQQRQQNFASAMQFKEVLDNIPIEELSIERVKGVCVQHIPELSDEKVAKACKERGVDNLPPYLNKLSSRYITLRFAQQRKAAMHDVLDNHIPAAVGNLVAGYMSSEDAALDIAAAAKPGAIVNGAPAAAPTAAAAAGAGASKPAS